MLSLLPLQVRLVLTLQNSLVNRYKHHLVSPQTVCLAKPILLTFNNRTLCYQDNNILPIILYNFMHSYSIHDLTFTINKLWQVDSKSLAKMIRY